jgi:hypothetical protein
MGCVEKSQHISPLFCASSFLTPDRLEKLNGIEFAWAVRGDTAEDGGDDEAAASDTKDGEGEAVVEAKEEEGESKIKKEEKGESKVTEDDGEAKKEEESKPEPEVKKDDDGEASVEKKVETASV